MSNAPLVFHFNTSMIALLVIGSILLLSRLAVSEQFILRLRRQGHVNLASGVLNVKAIPGPKEPVSLLNPLNARPRH
jgi:hypothetical protein